MYDLTLKIDRRRRCIVSAGRGRRVRRCLQEVEQIERMGGHKYDSYADIANYDLLVRGKDKPADIHHP